MADNKKELNFDEIIKNSGIAQMKLLSPTNKVNLDKDDDLHLVGAALITSGDIENDMKCDLEDLDNMTLLFINSRTILECTKIIDGALKVMVNNKIISPSIRNRVIDGLCSGIGNGIIRYHALKSLTNNAIGDIAHSMENLEVSEKVIDIINNKFKYIIDNVWFLPYNEIDNILKSVKEEYLAATGQKEE